MLGLGLVWGPRTLWAVRFQLSLSFRTRLPQRQGPSSAARPQRPHGLCRDQLRDEWVGGRPGECRPRGVGQLAEAWRMAVCAVTDASPGEAFGSACRGDTPPGSGLGGEGAPLVTARLRKSAWRLWCPMWVTCAPRGAGVAPGRPGPFSSVSTVSYGDLRWTGPRHRGAVLSLCERSLLSCTMDPGHEDVFLRQAGGRCTPGGLP